VGSPAPTALDDELRGILQNLTEGMFPLAAWVEDKIENGGYKPREHVPWRDAGSSLATKDLGAVEFFEELLGQSAEDLSITERLAQVIADPLRFSPLLEGTPDWRASRKLDSTPQFGIVASQNVIATADRAPATRAHFYAPFWSLLRQAVSDANPKTSADWESLARDLLNDASPHWPGGQPLKSSSFMKQFGRDMLHALLIMRNPAPDPWRLALLEEIGEHRRVGNSFTRDDVERFVRAFKERISAPEPTPSR
jgi:hypothetical protein